MLLNCEQERVISVASSKYVGLPTTYGVHELGDVGADLVVALAPVHRGAAALQVRPRHVHEALEECQIGGWAIIIALCLV